MHARYSLPASHADSVARQANAPNTPHRLQSYLIKILQRCYIVFWDIFDFVLLRDVKVSRPAWSRSHNRFLVSVSVSVSHSLVSVLALVSLCSGLINKLGSSKTITTWFVLFYVGSQCTVAVRFPDKLLHVFILTGLLLR